MRGEAPQSEESGSGWTLVTVGRYPLVWSKLSRGIHKNRCLEDSDDTRPEHFNQLGRLSIAFNRYNGTRMPYSNISHHFPADSGTQVRYESPFGCRLNGGHNLRNDLYNKDKRTKVEVCHESATGELRQ
ncbi:hypothetical protein ACP26L_09985 [Paenibacillus sp. S-38]|uniref:hypothetical protein n=1 Tax=Paenibacillus sp. S-38 TaxID=3416710 RepID=UPI003CE8AE27